jgi:ribonucleoside-diphosphate reductase alpha chain
MRVDLKNVKYELLEIIEKKEDFIDAMDIEVDDSHYYILDNGVVSHNSISCLAKTTSGIEPVFMLKYRRRKKINPNDEGVRVDFVDKMGDSWQEFNVYHPGFKEWMRISGETDEKKSPYYKATSNDIDWEASVDLQGAAQKWVCHAISKTCNLPNDATKETVEKVFFRGWEKQCKGLTVYRDDCRDGVLIKEESSDKFNKITKTDAPKRPKELICDIHHVSVKGNPYFIIVGLLNEEPYEVFAGNDIDKIIPHNIKKAIIKKERRGKYALYNIENKEEHIHKDISSYIGEDFETITRLISSNLRHGCDVNFVTHQLEKTKGDLMSFSKAIARVLKKYIKNGSMVSGESCPECGGELRRQEGCSACSCGFTRCS